VFGPCETYVELAKQILKDPVFGEKIKDKFFSNSRTENVMSLDSDIASTMAITLDKAGLGWAKNSKSDQKVPVYSAYGFDIQTKYFIRDSYTGDVDEVDYSGNKIDSADHYYKSKVDAEKMGAKPKAVVIHHKKELMNAKSDEKVNRPIENHSKEDINLPY
jgi:hypothetical protein